MTEDDPLVIPDFLRVTPAIAERRAAYNATHPVTAVSSFIMPVREMTEEAKVIEARRAEAERIAAHNRINKMLARKQEKEIHHLGMRWDNGRWVDPNMMTRQKFERLMSNMPTDAHRAICNALYADKVIGGIAPPKRAAK